MPDKYLQHDAAGGFQEVEATAVGGGGQADKIPALDSSGRFDSTMMPTGLGDETSIIPASGALAAGDLVNVFIDSGVARVRKADSSNTVAPANGFVLTAVLDAADATVYWSGLNNAVAGLTPGLQFLSTTAGTSTDAAPTASGNVVQRVGTAVSPTVMYFNPQDSILLA